MKTHIIQLDPHDDLLSTRDKMAWSKAPRILLVWPRRGRILDRKVDLVILQRHALLLGAQLGVVTGDYDVRRNAADAGIPSFSSAVQAQRGSWRKPRSMRRASWRSFHTHSDPADLRNQHEILHAQQVEDQWTRLAAFSVGILAVILMGLFFLPGAVIELAPQREEQRITLQAWASPEIREANPSGGMPAYEVSAVVEGSAQVPSSGVVGIPEEQASGNVEFSNLSEQEIKIPAGTVVLARGLGQDFVRFETTRPATLPAGVDQKVTIPVRAQVPGLPGNVKAKAVESVEGPLGLSVLATNLTAFRGGSERTSPAPKASDYQTAEEQLQQSLRTSALEDMQKQLAPGMRLLDGTLSVRKVLADTSEPAPGQPGDFARLNQQLEYSAWYVSDEDLNAVALTALDANRTAGFQPLEDSLKVDFATEAKLDENGAARWDLLVSRQLEAVWSDTQAAQALVGRSPDEVGKILAPLVPLTAPPHVELIPSWWVRLPFLAFRIAVVRR